jgi:hypothetical protein
MICTNCGAEADVLLIDTTLIGEARRRLRFCGSCRPEAQHPYAGCLPQVIMASSQPDEEKRKALAARRYVVDRSQSYALVERIIDLAGPIVGGIN